MSSRTLLTRIYTRRRGLIAFGLIAVALWVISMAAFNSDLFSLGLRGAGLAGAALQNRDLSNADLRGANLTGANLVGANLRGANLTGATLVSADLRGADFQNAILKYTDLSRADMRGALNLTVSQVVEAITNDTIGLVELGLATPTPTPQVAGPVDYSFSDLSTIALPYVPYKVALSQNGHLLAVAGRTPEVQLWRIGESVEKLPSMSGHTGDARSVTFRPDGTVVASGSEDGTLRLWRVGETTPYEELVGPEGFGFRLEFTSDGMTLVSASLALPRDEKTVRVWSLGPGERTPISTSSVRLGATERVVDIEPDLRLMVVMTPAIQGAQLRSIANNSLTRLLESSEQEITSGAFSPNGQTLTLGVKVGARGAALVWRVSDGRLIYGPFSGPEGEIVCMAFSPEGQLVAAGWTDGSIQLWRVADGLQLPPLQGHKGAVHDIAFSGGGVFASVGADKSIKLWLVTKK